MAETNEKPVLKKKWILTALMATMALAAMDSTIVATAIPQIVRDLGGFSMFSWVFSIYLLAQTITIPVYGKLADLYGRKPVLLVGVLVFLIGSGASAFSWDMISLILFRGLQGLGAGSIMATVNTIAGDIYSIEERAKVQGWLSSVWGVSAIIGPLLGGTFADYVSWRWIFIINIPIGLASMALIAYYLKENVEKKKHKIDYLGAAAMMLAGTLLIFTLMEGGQRWPWFSLTGIGFIALTALLIGVTVWIEKHAPEPILPNWVWSNKIITGSNLSVVMMGAILLGPSMYLPIFAQSVLGLGAVAAGFILGSSSIGWPIASSISGKLYLKIGFRNTAMIGAFMLILLSLTFLILPYKSSAWLLVADQVLLGAGFGLLSTPTIVGVQSIVPWEKRGVVTGSNMFARYLGQTIGAAVLGGVFNIAMNKYMAAAPVELKGQLPGVNDVITVLQSGKASAALQNYLEYGFFTASHHVYITMAVIGVLAFIFLIPLPRHFPIVED